MTKQEIFDKVAIALIKQGKPSLADNGTCSYYNNGYRCAIGWLVDVAQAKELEKSYKGEGIATIRIDSLNAEHYFGVDPNFLERIQDAHDVLAESESWFQGWKHRMKDIADEYGLDKSVLNNVK